MAASGDSERGQVKDHRLQPWVLIDLPGAEKLAKGPQLTHAMHAFVSMGNKLRCRWAPGADVLVPRLRVLSSNKS